MKTLYFMFLIPFITLYANSTQELYTDSCAVCHNTRGPEMLAPPMSKIVNKLKMLKSRDSFVLFVSDYIKNPSKEKGYCMPKAYERFGVMPAVAMSESKAKELATWLYDNFKSDGNTRYQGGKSCGSKSCCSSKGVK